MPAYLFVLTIYDGTFRAVVANTHRQAVNRLDYRERVIETRKFILS